MTERSEYVTADDGVRLFVQTIGNGSDVVIIPNRVYLADAFARLATNRTLIFCDPRNRGRSDQVSEPSKIEQGVHHDVEDFDAIRRHFGVDRVSLLGHSYMGFVVILYAMKFAAHTDRVVAIGAIGPDPAQRYSGDLVNEDRTFTAVLARLAELQQQRPSLDAVDFCRKFWSTLRPLYVVDPADADRLGWEPCDLPNEINFMKPFTEHILPSMQRLHLAEDQFARVLAPVLVVHGRKDRSAPYGGGRDWAMKLPDARLLTIDNAAHVPWIEAPNVVFEAIDTFLDRRWPATAEQISSG